MTQQLIISLFLYFTMSAPAADKNVVGTWNLVLEVPDLNENKIMEEGERQKGFKNKYILELKANGTCRIQKAYNGKYELKKEKGKDMLYVYRERTPDEKKDPVPDIYEIKSLKQDEMIVLQWVAGFSSNFWIFKKG